MLLSGINHVAVLTAETHRFLEFYGGVLDATHEALQDREDDSAWDLRVLLTLEARMECAYQQW